MEALKIEFTHMDEIKTYKKTDIKYDIEHGWIFLEPPSSGGIVEIDFNEDNEDGGDPAVGGGPPPENRINQPSTPLSGAPTPLRPIDRSSRPATRSQTTPLSGRLQQRAETSARNSRLFSKTGRPIIPPTLDNDDISAMLERGTLERDLMLWTMLRSCLWGPVSHLRRPST